MPIRAVPRAPRDVPDGVGDGASRVPLAAPPVEGAANKALIAFLATMLDFPKRDLTLIAGEKGRHKRVLVRGLTAADVLARLRIWLFAFQTNCILAGLGIGMALRGLLSRAARPIEARGYEPTAQADAGMISSAIHRATLAG